MLSIAAASCNVYDPALTHRLDSSALVGTASPLVDAGETIAPPDVDSGEQPACGDGVVDPGERCDVAIAHGELGACPDGCSGRDGCVEQKMIGRGCQAHCEAVEIERAIPNDGCCPRGASAKSDPDCEASCGNGIIETGEHCDPPETCVVAEACVRKDSCQTPEYSGDPAQCTASCTLRPIESCVDGDGCCPAGCNAAHDSDCAGSAPPSLGATLCDAGCEASDAGALDVGCSTGHHGGDCESCDCARCQDTTTACTGMSGGDGALCNAVLACAAQAHCSGIDCYCGPLASTACAQLPLGPCVKQVRAAAGSNNAYQILTLGVLNAGPIGRALAALNCRKTECPSECSLPLPP